ncbi:MAG: ABC transporter permease [Eubacteriaceae bacterium]|nr:ABC transporter permease [Eubacteriaceae bacterium]
MRFASDFKKYINYALYSAAAELKNQVHGTYLGWVWWILDPLLYMAVYSFVVEGVFGAKIENFSVFVFIGLSAWNYFSASANSSVSVVRSYRSVLQKAYIPKFILVLIVMFINFFKMALSFAILIAAMAAMGLKLQLAALCFFPLIAVYSALIFGLCLISAHIGVYIADLSNVTVVATRVLFYFSGIFYDLKELPQKLMPVYFYVCPTGFFVRELRACLLYAQPCDFKMLAYWLTVAALVSLTGLSLMYRNENSYMKAV